MSIHTLVGLVSRCVRLCRENREQTPARAVRADLGRFPTTRGGRKEQQDKEQASSVALCSVTSARSAGSYGSFRGVPKWGQNQRGDITSTVVIPESLLTQEKSRGSCPRKDAIVGKKVSSALPNARAEDTFLQTNTLKNCVAKQRISLGSVQTVIDNNLITLPGWDGY